VNAERDREARHGQHSDAAERSFSNIHTSRIPRPARDDPSSGARVLHRSGLRGRPPPGRGHMPAPPALDDRSNVDVRRVSAPKRSRSSATRCASRWGGPRGA
jgi:hypothetical protein